MRVECGVGNMPRGVWNGLRGGAGVPVHWTAGFETRAIQFAILFEIIVIIFRGFVDVGVIVSASLLDLVSGGSNCIWIHHVIFLRTTPTTAHAMSRRVSGEVCSLFQ